MEDTRRRDEHARNPAPGREGRPVRRSRSEEGLVKKSIVLPPKTAAAAEELATAEGVSLSALMTRAVEELLGRVRRELAARTAADELVADYEASFGPMPAESYARADAFLRQLDEHYGQSPETR
jgi:hypothetical protein